MIAEKSTTAIELLDRMTGAPKVAFINGQKVSEALMYLSANGIPNAKHEEYKYCNMDAVFRKEFKQVTYAPAAVSSINDFQINDAVTIVVENGRYNPELSDKVVIRGLNICSLNEAKLGDKIASLANPTSDTFIALNTAFSGEGFYLGVQDNAEIPMTIHVLYVSSSNGEGMVNPRSFIEIGQNASLHLVEQQVVVGEGKVFSNYVSEKVVHENGRLYSTLLQHEGDKGYSVNTTIAEVKRDAVYDNTTLTFSGQVVRNNHHVLLTGSNSVAHLNGLFTAENNRLIDNHTLMDHQVPHCESNELYKGLASDKGTGVFNGKIFVRKDAQKTNAYQSSKNILLSDDATINTKPQLEIYANDVKCSHGTSTGKIDPNHLFYLRARGVGQESARKMLLASFAHEVIEKIADEGVREKAIALFEQHHP